MKNLLFFFAASVGTMIQAETVLAQETDTQEVAINCELHFWGSKSAETSSYSGVGGVAGGLLAGPSPQTGRGLLNDLPLPEQVRALESINLAGLLKMPGVRVISEGVMVDQVPAWKSKSRLTSSSTPCYAELIVEYIGYSSHITAGRKFGARFWLRRYPENKNVAFVQSGGKDVKLRIYPAKVQSDHPAALVELRDAFGKTVEGFLLKKVK